MSNEVKAFSKDLYNLLLHIPFLSFYKPPTLRRLSVIIGNKTDTGGAVAPFDGLIFY